MKITNKIFQKDPVEHFVDGRYSLIKVASGLVRHRGIAFIIFIIAVLTILPFPDITIILKNIVISLCLLFLASIFYLRVRARRSLDIKYQLHMISHAIRNKHLLINKSQKPLNIEELTSEICFLIRDYFKLLTNKEGIGVAVRIAIKKEGITYYKTMGRAGLNNNRSDSSEDLSEHEGLAKLFNTKAGNHGMIQLNNLEKAEKEGAFIMTANDRNYPHDIKKMMVCPINGWDGKDKGMLGILYITTSERFNIFGEKYTDSMGFISDALAVVYSELITSLVSISENKDIQITLNENDKYKINEDSNEPIKIT